MRVSAIDSFASVLNPREGSMGMCVCVYIYIVIGRQTVSFYQNSSVYICMFD